MLAELEKRGDPYLAQMLGNVAAWPAEAAATLAQHVVGRPRQHATVRDPLVQPRYHVYYTPTYSSWLNQVERWFGLLSVCPETACFGNGV